MSVSKNPQQSSESTFPPVDWLEVDSPIRMVIREKSGGRLSIPFNQPLSDGTLLSDRVNARLHTTIREVVYYSRYGATDCSVSSGATQRNIARKLVNLASWMISQGVYDYSQLSMTHLLKFLAAAGNGYESLANAPRRVFEYMEALIADGKDIGKVKFSEVRKDVFGNTLQYPLAQSVFDGIKAHCSKRLFSEYEYIEPKPNRPEASLYQTARAAHLLYILRDYLSSSLSFEPFPDGLPNDIKTNSRGHTPTIPEVAALHLLQNAVHWVMVLGPKLLALYRGLKWGGTTKNKPATKRRLVDTFNEKYSENIGLRISRNETSEPGHIYCMDAIRRFLPAACLIVVGVLSARRRVEILTLMKDAISGSRVKGHWLKSYIAKTSRVRDLVPVPEVVAMAVKLMILYGKTVRASANKFIFVTHAYRKRSDGLEDEFVGKLDERIDRFATATGNPFVLGDKGWEPWHYSCHQMRKIFAILYVWRYDAGDLSSLSYHLRHFSLEMTLTYVKDKEMIRLIGGEMYRLAARKTQAMLNGAIHPAGTFGKKLLRMVERLRPKIHLASDTDVERQLLALMRSSDVSLKANPWGFCACKAAPSNIRRAACQQEDCRTGKRGLDGRPDHTGSDEVRCSKCFFFFTDETRSKHWQGVENELSKGLQKEVNLAPLMRERLEKHLAKLRGFASHAFVQG